jgi:hypothetical protein
MLTQQRFNVRTNRPIAGPPFSPRLSILAHPATVAVKETNNAVALSGLDLLMFCSFMFN